MYCARCQKEVDINSVAVEHTVKGTTTVATTHRNVCKSCGKSEFLWESLAAWQRKLEETREQKRRARERKEKFNRSIWPEIIKCAIGFGVAGAAWGTIIVFWGFVIPYCLVVCSRLVGCRWNRLLSVRYLGGVLLMALFAAGVSTGIQLLLVNQGVLLRALVTICVFSITTLALMWSYFRSDVVHVERVLIGKRTT